jgi:hypothetical protein
VQPVDVRQQHQQPRVEQDRDLRREEVVVAERDLVGGGRVVLVHHRNHAPLEQPPQRPSRVHVVGSRREVDRGQQDLRRVHARAIQPLLVRPEQRPLPHRRRRLQLVDRLRPLGEVHHPPAARDRARGHHRHVLPAPVQLADLRADRVEHVRAQLTALSGDYRGAEFGDDGHPAASLGTD